MILFILLLMLLAIYKMPICRSGIFTDYISLESIQPIKGIFLLLIIFSHFNFYVDLHGALETPYFIIRQALSQLVVVPFLFYSGYGIMESIRKKGPNYIAKLPKHRILKVLFQFDIAVLLYLLLKLLQGTPCSLQTVLLSLAAWEEVGNDNWYVFAILFLYAATWIAFSLFYNRPRSAIAVVTLLSVLYILVIQGYKNTSWYNTVLVYAAGMWFSEFKPQLEAHIFSKEHRYRLFSGIILLAFVFARLNWKSIWIYESASVLFALVMVLATMKLKVQNRLLAYCGEHLFSMFILHRLPMIILDGTVIEQWPYLFLIVCLCITLALAHLFDLVVPRLWDGLMRITEKTT